MARVRRARNRDGEGRESDEQIERKAREAVGSLDDQQRARLATVMGKRLVYDRKRGRWT